MASSNANLRTCPSAADLHRYHAQELSANEAAAIQAHLAGRPACTAHNAALLADHETWVLRLRAAGMPPAERGVSCTWADAQLGRDEIAGYEIREEIGRGGQGIVYRALQKSTQ